MSATAPNKPKLHQALTSDEAREAIILDFTNELRRKLIAAGLEGQHTTFVNAQWVGGVKVKAFLRKPADVKVVGSLGEAGGFDSELEVPASIEREVKNPETVREELKGGRGEVGELLAVGELAEFTVEDIADTPKSENPFPLTDVVEARENENAARLDTNAPDGHADGVHDARSGVDVVPASEMDSGGREGSITEASVTEASFILSRSESHADLSGIESEIVETQDTFVDDAAKSLTGELGEGLASHIPNDAIGSTLCQFCSRPLSDNKAGIASHMRTHVRSGEAVQFTNGDGELAWRPI